MRLQRVRKGFKPHELGSYAPILTTFLVGSRFPFLGHYSAFGVDSGRAKKRSMTTEKLNVSKKTCQKCWPNQVFLSQESTVRLGRVRKGLVTK